MSDLFDQDADIRAGLARISSGSRGLLRHYLIADQPDRDARAALPPGLALAGAGYEGASVQTSVEHGQRTATQAVAMLTAVSA